MSSADAAVGSISHILQTAFKDDLDERKKIIESKKKKLQKEIKQRELEEKRRLAEEAARLEAERLAIEMAAKKSKKPDSKVAQRSESTGPPAMAVVDHEDDAVSDDDEIYDNPVDLLPLSDRHQAILKTKLENIEQEIQQSNNHAEELVNYLTKQRDLAREEEIKEEENLKRQGIMIGQHIPSLVSKLEINPSVLQSFGPYSSNLIITRELIEQNHERKLRRTGNLPITEDVEIKFQQRKLNKSQQFADGGDEDQPNYLQLTSGLRERNNLTKTKFVSYLPEKTNAGGVATMKSTLGATVAGGKAKATIPKRNYGQSAIEKEQDQQILKTIQHKLNYLRNPRNAPDAVSRTLVTKSAKTAKHHDPSNLPPPPSSVASASVAHAYPPPSGPSSVPLASSISGASSISKRGSATSTISKTGSSLFLTEPSVILFNSYDIGQKYSASISFRNISSVSRSLRVIPPSSSHFSLSPLQYPSQSKAGIVAPGMVVLSEISFFPQSLCDYSDVLHVETEGGSYTVPLYGKRNPPQLSLSSLVDIGSCLVGDALRTSIPCTNNGGRGKFKLLKQEWYPGGTATALLDDMDYSGCIRCTPFTLYPLEFELNRYESTHITIEFIPIEIKVYQVTLVILFDNEQYITVTLQGEGKAIQCKMTEINSVSLSTPSPSSSSPSPSSRSTLIKDLYFHHCPIGSEHEQEIMVSNTTGLSLEYEWVWIESKSKDIKMNALNKLMIQDEQQEEKIEEKFLQITKQKKKKSKGGAGGEGSSGRRRRSDSLMRTDTGNGDDDEGDFATNEFSMDLEDSHSNSSMGGYSVSPGRGVFASYGSSPFLIKFRPSTSEMESGRMVLVLRDVTTASLPGPHQDVALTSLFQKKHGPYYRFQSWLDEIGSDIVTSQTKHELDDLFLKGLKPHNIVSKKVNLETLWNIVVSHSQFAINSYLLITVKYVLSRLLSKCYRWINRNSVDREIPDDDSIFGGAQEDEDEEGSEEREELEEENSLSNPSLQDSNTIGSSIQTTPSSLQFRVIHWDPNSPSDETLGPPVEDNFGAVFPTFSLNLNKEKLFEEDLASSDELSASEIPFNITHNLSKYLDIDSAEGRKLRKVIWLSIPSALDLLGTELCEILDDKVKHESVDFLQRLSRVNLPILDLNVTGYGIIPSIYLSPPLLTSGGVIGIGTEWRGEVTIHNDSPIMNEVNINPEGFHCENLKTKEQLEISLSNSSLILHPNSSETITVTLIFKEIGEYLVNIPVIPASPHIVINDIMIQAVVIGPKIRFEAPELNLGLLNTGMELTSILSFTNDTNIPLCFNLSCQLDSLLNNLNAHKRVHSSPAKMSTSSSAFPLMSNRDRDDDTHSVAHSSRSQMTENSSDSYAIDNNTALITFDPPMGTLADGASCQVKVKCVGGKFPQRIKGVIECAITDITRHSTAIPAQYLSLRGEVQSPLTMLSPIHRDLGNVYVNTPARFTLTLTNLTSLPSKFKFDRPGGDSAAYRLKYSQKNGELEGKETRVIEVEYTAIITGVTDDVIACKIFGLTTPLGYQLKAIAKGIQVEFLPLEANQPPPAPLASKSDPQYPGPGPVPDPAPMKPLDFTSTVTLYERVVRRFALRNLSPMVVSYELKPRKYDVGELLGLDGDEETSITSSLIEPPISGQGLLVPREDGENRFHSQEGKKYIGAILKRRQDKHYLTLGLGASYSFEPRFGQINPWDVVVVTVLSRNDMSGCFDDDIICDIKDHRKLYFPMKMTVIGCPLIIERDSYGMSTYSTEEDKKTDSPSSSLMLQMGSSTVNSEPIVRDFRVRNNGSSPATIKWKLRSVASKVNGPIKFELKVGRTSGGGGGSSTKMGVKSNLLFWDDVAKDSPFEVDPKSTVIPPYSRKNFKIKFFRTSHCVNELALLTGGISFDGETNGGGDGRSQTASRNNLFHEDSLSNGSRSPPGNTSAMNNSTSMETLGTLRHTTMKPTYNISLYLKADIMLPEIKVDKNILVTTNQKITHATNHPITLRTDAPQLYSRQGGGGGGSGRTNPICRKVIVLTNPIPALLAFSVSIEGPFTVKYSPDVDEATKASGSQVNNSHLSPSPSSSSSSVGGTCVLQSNASARFTVSFQPKKELRNTLLQNTSLSGAEANQKEAIKEKEKGTLIISFSTGQQIYIPISVTIATPYLTASSPRLFYGTCHVTRSCQGVLLLSNPTDVTAKWSVAHVPESQKTKKASAIRVKGFGTQAKPEDDPTVFEISPQSGVLSGPTVSPAAATFCPPNDVNRRYRLSL
jgi:hypothetical protein